MPPQDPRSNPRTRNPRARNCSPTPLRSCATLSPPPTKSTAWAEATRSRWTLPAGPTCRPSWWWDRTGALRLPLAGDILLDGLTRTEASKAIATALASYYDNLAVQVTVTKYTANRVLVLGAVTTPGEVTFEGTPTLLEALTRSGLFTRTKQARRDSRALRHLSRQQPGGVGAAERAG